VPLRFVRGVSNHKGDVIVAIQRFIHASKCRRVSNKVGDNSRTMPASHSHFQSKGIAEIYGIAVRESVEIEPARQPNRIRLRGIDRLGPPSYSRSSEVRRLLALAACPVRQVVVFCGFGHDASFRGPEPVRARAPRYAAATYRRPCFGDLGIGLMTISHRPRAVRELMSGASRSWLDAPSRICETLADLSPRRSRRGVSPRSRIRSARQPKSRA